jgi:ABC-type multidrug transport system ATPase subunit
MRPYHDQPVARVLAFFAGVYQCSPTHLASVVAAVGLAPVLAKRVHALSKGYSRRLMLAVGLLTPQPLLLMDEPFDGFDLRQTREIMGVLRQYAAAGRTLVLAIHQLLDAERVCDRFVLLADGRIRGTGTLGELRTQTQLPTGSLEEIFLHSVRHQWSACAPLAAARERAMGGPQRQGLVDNAAAPVPADWVQLRASCSAL